MAVATGWSSRRATAMEAAGSASTAAWSSKTFDQDLRRHAVGRVGLGVDTDEFPHPGFVLDQAHRHVLRRGGVGERGAADHLRHAVAEGLEPGLPARDAQIVVLAAVAHLDGEAALQPAEERVGRGHQRRAAQRVVGAECPVGDHRYPGPAGAEHDATALQQSAPAAPVGERAVEGDEGAVAELCFGRRWRCSGSVRVPQQPPVKTCS